MPLFGTRKIERFEENIGALSVTLTKADLDEIEAADIKIEGAPRILRISCEQLAADGVNQR